MSEDLEKFSNFISLVSACQTASSMAKYGLRSWFDGAEEFLEYCVRRYDVMSLIKNIAFDRNKQEKIYEDIKEHDDSADIISLDIFWKKTEWIGGA